MVPIAFIFLLLNWCTEAQFYFYIYVCVRVCSESSRGLLDCIYAARNVYVVGVLISLSLVVFIDNTFTSGSLSFSQQPGSSSPFLPIFRYFL